MTDAFRPRVALITGASGFVGGRLRDSLLADGWDVVALVRPGSPPAKRGRSAPVEYGNVDSLTDVVGKEKPELIFHVAGATKGITEADFDAGNRMPTENLLTATRRVHPGVRRFVHVSSLAAFGPATRDDPRGEHHERRPVEHYGQSKLNAEKVLEAAGDAVPWTMVRPPTVYGPGDVDNFQLFRLTTRGLNVFYGNRKRLMSFVYVDDLVRGMREAADSDTTRGKGYFLCDGTPVTWEQYQQMIVEASGRRVRDLDLPEALVSLSAVFGELATRIDNKPRLFNRQKAILGMQEAWTCRHDVARAEFGYRPQVDLREGVRRTFEWYRSEGWL